MTSNLTKISDDLGTLKARIADLETQEKALKQALADLGPGAYEGEIFRLSISESVRATLDMEAVRAKLTPQFIRAHTRETEVRTLRVVARTGKVAA